VERVHAVVGGFHLTGALFEPIIGPTVAGLGEMAPDVLLPAHCTGWRAMHELANRMPEAFIANSIGTSLQLVAA
jgi:7,8-dihydropterin-6-yl-methyl-4-(beta-D-ribofuranosyl)aminobenzene 5'-phosphate synthase